MKLADFLNYKTECPICGGQLKTIFHSRKIQGQRIEDDRLVFIFRMNALNKGQSFAKVGYSIDANDNSIYIEFYNKNGEKFENESPEWLRIRFWELDKNLKGYKFYRECYNVGCKRYMYDSNSFIINYKSCNMGDLSIKSEHIGLCQSVDDGYKIFKMYNDFTTNKTNLTVFKDSTDLWAMVNSGIPFYGANATDLSLPIIKFSSREETTERLSKLIVFS